LTLAPRSSSAFSMWLMPIVQEIVGHPGSLYLIGSLHWRIELTYSVKKTFFGTLVFRFTVTKSFKNLA
jgi:hypothetical protein